MTASHNEEKFNALVQSIDFDLRYRSFCKERINLSVPSGRSIDLSDVTSCVERLPLSFRYMKSEKFFRHQEKFDGFTLLFHLSVRGSVIQPMIYLKTGEGIVGDPFAMLTWAALKRREGVVMPPERELALCFSNTDELYEALEFSTTLYVEMRKITIEASPWS
ncbi:hypothetical protein ACFT7S_01640 [Streptomyces sp. NPDC057136]|uniref:hypothetical protein n=1 Tax=Streptomyces sp. NPDC057136 TaxID=3346029 RepID=UPI003634A957